MASDVLDPWDEAEARKAVYEAIERLLSVGAIEPAGVNEHGEITYQATPAGMEMLNGDD